MQVASAEKTAVVVQAEPLEESPVSATNNGPLCPGDSLVLTATTVAGATYSWTGPGGFTSTLQNPTISNITAAMAGNYTVSINVISPPCSSTSTTTLVVNPKPTILNSGDITMYIGASTQIFATGGTTYNWSPTTNLNCASCDSTMVNPSQTTTYCATVTNAAGCVDSSCLTVTIVLPCLSNRTMETPNAFTPNGDGINDKFCLDGWDDCISEFEVLIFDRWGAKLYQSKDPSFCWDGIYKGKPLDPAVFVYFIKATYDTEGANPQAPKGKINITKTGRKSNICKKC